MKISLKKKKLISGRISLYLEYYKGYSIDDNGKQIHDRSFDYLKIYLHGNPITTTEKNENKEALKLAENILTLKQAELIKGTFNIENNDNLTSINAPIQLLKATPKSIENLFIDSLFITRKTTTEIKINVVIKSTTSSSENVPVSLFNNSKLFGKATAKFNNSNVTNVEFTIPNAIDFYGKIALNDTALEFDNDYFFTLSKPGKINVLSIGNSSDFLAKIYTENEFNFTTTPLQNLNYNLIQNQQLIIVNELEELPIALVTSLKEYYFNGGNLVLIPSEKTIISSYNNLLRTLNQKSYKCRR